MFMTAIIGIHGEAGAERTKVGRSDALSSVMPFSVITHLGAAG